MERPLPYLLIVLLFVGGWNESFKSRFDRLTGKTQEQPTEAVSTEATPAPTTAVALKPTPKPTPKITPAATVAPATPAAVPFFNDPNYHSPLDRVAPKKTH